MDLMFNQIKLKMELADQEVQSCEVQNMLNFWVKQLSCVVSRTACRSILAGAAFFFGAAVFLAGAFLATFFFTGAFFAAVFLAGFLTVFFFAADIIY